jgi:hypothetical protein
LCGMEQHWWWHLKVKDMDPHFDDLGLLNLFMQFSLKHIGVIIYFGATFHRSLDGSL